MPGRWSCIGMVLTATATAVAGQVTLANDAPGASPLTDVVIESGDASFRIRLWVTVDGEPVADRFVRAQSAWVERLFGHLDRNDDACLSPDEAVHAPSPQMELPESVLAGETENVNVAFNFRAVDGNYDGHATCDELLEFYRFFGDGPIRVRHPRGPEIDDRQLDLALRTRLNENGDGLLSIDELSRASKKLMALDRDGNEVLDALELIGPVGDVTNVARAGGDGSRYRIRTASPNGSAADLDVFINYPGGDSGGLPDIRVEHTTRPPDVPDRDAGVLLLNLNGVSVELLTKCGPLRVLDRTRRLLALEFYGADADRDEVVHVADRLAEYLEQMFPLLDDDGDDAVNEAELNGFTRQLLPLEAEALGSQVSLDFIPPRDGLFAMLDTNHDGRLGRRELQSAAQRGRFLDAEANGSLELTEMRSPIRITIERGSLTAPYATDRSADSGPVWFVRMDRNRDGDVSANEFLASGDIFDRIDIDGDGLIGLAEALRAESPEGGL